MRARTTPVARSARDIRSQAHAARSANPGAAANAEKQLRSPSRSSRTSTVEAQQSGNVSANDTSAGRKIFRGAKMKPGRTRKTAGNHHNRWESRNRTRVCGTAFVWELKKYGRNPGTCLSIQTYHGATIA